MKGWLTSAFVLLVACTAGTAAAQCCPGGKAKADQNKPAECSATKQCGASKVCDAMAKNECPGKLMKAAGTPLMTMKVGEESTTCPTTFERLVKENPDAKVAFLVGDKEYTESSAALVAYCEALDEYLGSLTAVRYGVGDKCVCCPTAAAALAKESGKPVRFQLASFTFEAQPEAEKAAKVAKEAADKVCVKMIVDGKEFTCRTTARKAAGLPADGKACCGDKGNCDASKCDPAKCDPAKCDPAKCDPAKCDPAKCDPAKCDPSKCHPEKGAEKTAGKLVYMIGEYKTCCEQSAEVALRVAKIAAAHQAIETLKNPTTDKAVAGL